jgi:hypothetical protein
VVDDKCVFSPPVCTPSSSEYAQVSARPRFKQLW